VLKWTAFLLGNRTQGLNASMDVSPTKRYQVIFVSESSGRRTVLMRDVALEFAERIKAAASAVIEGVEIEEMEAEADAGPDHLREA
jgi:hypothetical protein